MTNKRRYTNPKGIEVSKVTCDYSKETPQIIEDETLGKTATAYCWIIGIIIGSLITYILYTL